MGSQPITRQPDIGIRALGRLPALSDHLSVVGAACAGLVTLWAYRSVWGAGWVFDDLGWDRTPEAMGGMTTMAWAPFAFARWVGGGLPWAFHGLVLGLHLLNGLLLSLIARRWLSPMAVSLALVLFWLHPLQAESVAYVSGGVEVLLGYYVLLAIWGGLSSSWVLRGIGLVSLGLAVTLKPSALPLLIVVPSAMVCANPRWRGRLLWSLIGVALVALVGWPEMVPRVALVDLEHWAEAVGRYLAFVVWPVGFSIEHDWQAVPAWVGLVAISGIALAGVLAWQLRASWSAPWWAWLWIVALVLPRALMSGPPLTQHHVYVPFLAVWLLAGSALDYFVSEESPCLQRLRSISPNPKSSIPTRSTRTSTLTTHATCTSTPVRA